MIERAVESPDISNIDLSEEDQIILSQLTLSDGYFDTDKILDYVKKISDKNSEGRTPSYLETPIDIVSILIGLSAINNWDGSTELQEKLLDMVGLTLDVTSLGIPGLAVGAGITLKGLRSAEQIMNSARKLGLKAKGELVDFVDFTKRTLGNQVGAVGDIDKLVDAAKGASRSIIPLKTQLQNKFKHARVFGINGNENKATLELFSDAIQNHVKSKTTKVIEGTYHQTQKVIHYIDPITGINVMKDYQGKFISNWRLSAKQLNNVLERGSL